MATSSIGQIVVLDNEMAERMIESMESANDRPFGQPTGFFREATEEETKQWIQALSRKNEDN